MTGFNHVFTDTYYINVLPEGQKKVITAVDFDFAVLSHCNHSVNNDGGTFSFWASFFSGGQTYQPWDFYNQSKRLELSQQLSRAKLPNYHNVAIPERVPRPEDAKVKKDMLIPRKVLNRIVPVNRVRNPVIVVKKDV